MYPMFLSGSSARYCCKRCVCVLCECVYAVVVVLLCVCVVKIFMLLICSFRAKGIWSSSSF